jgi:hypothetical protein
MSGSWIALWRIVLGALTSEDGPTPSTAERVRVTGGDVKGYFGKPDRV